MGGTEGGVEEELDSTGEVKGTLDYVDEKRLESEETDLSQEERKVFILSCRKKITYQQLNFDAQLSLLIIRPLGVLN